jgi:glycosyltransferase involved in cell wall biosynthesis
VLGWTRLGYPWRGYRGWSGDRSGGRHAHLGTGYLTDRPATLLHVFPTFAVGGAQARFAAVANHLGGAARHVIVSLDGRTDAREKLDPGLDVRFAPAPPARGRLGGLPGALGFLRAICAERGADRLITSNWGAMDWAIANRITRLPHLHTEDGFGPEEQDHQLTRRAWTRRIVLQHSDVALPSQTLLRIAREQWRLPEARLHAIPNGIDTARFAAAEPVDPALLAALGTGPVIGTIAALRPEKNLGRLLEAFALLRACMPARLVIVGRGGEQAALEARAAALGVAGAVLFAGHTAAPERWMASFDVFGLSSDTEQMPLSVLEAMASGLAVVATDVGDVRLMVAPDNAPFIVARDAAAMADAFARALAAGAEVGAANRARARAVYDQADMLARYRVLLGLGVQ